MNRLMNCTRCNNDHHKCDHGEGCPVASQPGGRVPLPELPRGELTEDQWREAVLKGWCGKHSAFELTIAGPFGEREGTALLRLLAVQLDVMTDGVKEDQRG